ncbi:urotensin-2B [Xenopus laevis]|uniref:Urotensin-2B n=2 Tax=Xenopus laevis TaxID=8355 RepID=A0A310U4Z8_XENLA|nr:urotensin-2B [Xenopus laevis]OCT56700.1 hypothetical protein XELAEV_18004532mg [Xenopus laevis]
MDKVTSIHLCLGTVLVVISMHTVQTKPYLLQELELESKLKQLEQLEKLKEQLMEGKTSDITYAVKGIASSHPNKQACFWKYCV